MTEDLDLPGTGVLCRMAVLRHQMSERQMVMALTLIELTFGAHPPAPSLFLERAIDIARLTGFSKGTSKLVIDQISRARVLELSPDRRIYTVIPPSEADPWLFLPRVDARLAGELTAGVLWASRSHHAGEGQLFGRPDQAEREFPDALQLERIRRALLDHHREAARLPPHFPVTDHSPKPAPGRDHGLSSGAGPSWPPGSAGGDYHPAQSFRAESETPPENAGGGLTKREPGSQIENPPIKSFKVSELSDSQTQKLLKAVEFSNREPSLSGKVLVAGAERGEPRLSGEVLAAGRKEPSAEDLAGKVLAVGLERGERSRPIGATLPDIDPGMDEDGFIRWLRQVLLQPLPDGRAVMDRYGGDWRNCWRESRWAALNTLQNLRNRIANPDPSVKPLRNPGGWARDEYNRIRKEENA